MESQSRKRFRKDGNSKSTELSSESSRSSLPDSNEDQRSIETIPELVSVIFLQYLRDVRILKVCRLVSKSWNIYASESLRTCSKVFLREGNPALKDFTKLLLQRSFGQLQDLPSPFQNFHAEGRSFIDPTFQALISLPNISITSLDLILDNPTAGPNVSQLLLLLTANQTKIENLTITANEGYVTFKDDSFKNDGIKLTSLKFLEIRDNCEDCTHVGIMKSFLRMCQPERMDVSFDDGDSMHSLLLEASIDNLKQFLLDSEIFMPSWEYLKTLRFSRIRKLTLMDRDMTWPDDSPQRDLIFQNVSPLLEELVTTFPISTRAEPKFLNLKTIEVSLNTEFSALTHRKFPSLEKVIVYYQDYNGYQFLENIPNPHVGVQSLEMEIANDDIYNLMHQDLMALLTYLGQQFPKVTSLTFTISKFDATTVTVGNIFKVFPKLTELSLDGRCDFKDFSGNNNVRSAKYEEPDEHIPRQESITDFLELETIVFGSSFVVDPDMVRYCLRRVPKLKEVSLHWNESLSAPLLCDSIGHLERITILNTDCEYGGFEDAMAQVAEMLPNACIK